MARKIDYLSKKTKDNLRLYFLKILEIIKKPEMGVLPGQIAFSMLLSIVPIITLVGFGASFFGINMDTVISMLNNFIPGGAETFLPYLSGGSIDFALALLFLWMFYLASNGCNSIILISNQIYGINKSNFIKRRVKAVFMTLAIMIVLLFILLVPVFGSKIIELLKFTTLFDSLYKIIRFLKGPFMWLVMFVFLRAFYEVAPDRVRKNSHINTGAVFTTIGWIVVTNIYSYLAHNMSNYNLFYGALSNIAFLMMWLYFMSFVFVIGLSLNYGEEYEKEQMDKTGAVRIIKKK